MEALLPGTGSENSKHKPQARRTPEIVSFANYFKWYMAAAATFTSALSWLMSVLKPIPNYSALTPLLSPYTTVLSFLLLAYIFHSRDYIARFPFSEQLNRPRDLGSTLIRRLPDLLIVITIVSATLYPAILVSSIRARRDGLSPKAPSSGAPQKAKDQFAQLTSFDYILQDTSLDDVPSAIPIAICYLIFFLSATGALGVMAVQEYVRDAFPATEERPVQIQSEIPSDPENARPRSGSN